MKVINRSSFAVLAGTLTMVVGFQNCGGFSAGKLGSSAQSSLAAADAQPAATPDPGTGTSATPTPTPTAVTCAPVVHYKFPLAPSMMSCDSYQILGTYVVPVNGYALARVSFTVNNSSANTETFRFQSIVGDSAVAPAAGGDLMPGLNTSQAVMGYGHLSASNQTVVINATSQGTDCVSNAIAIASGTLDVWVEDDQAACHGQDIVVASTTNWTPGTSFPWADQSQNILSLNASLPANRTSAAILSQSEATVEFPAATATVGAALTAQPFLQGAALASAQATVKSDGFTSAVTQGPIGRGFLSTSQTMAITESPVVMSLGVLSTVVNSTNTGGPIPTYSGQSAVAATPMAYGDSILAVIFQP